MFNNVVNLEKSMYVMEDILPKIKYLPNYTKYNLKKKNVWIGSLGFHHKNKK